MRSLTKSASKLRESLPFLCYKTNHSILFLYYQTHLCSCVVDTHQIEEAIHGVRTTLLFYVSALAGWCSSLRFRLARDRANAVFIIQNITFSVSPRRKQACKVMHAPGCCVYFYTEMWKCSYFDAWRYTGENVRVGLDIKMRTVPTCGQR